MNIVETSNIIKNYAQGRVIVRAIRGISLSIEKGSFAALAGPSGSGKTTMLNLIGGLDKFDSGKIRVGGKNYGDLTQSALAEMRLRHLGFVFQAYNLIPVLSALENVEYVMLLQGVPAKERLKRAKTILEEVGLQGMHHRRPRELSGGQQQRVAVARALVTSPDLVLADEPTANLDSKTGEALLKLMHRMNQLHGVTFLFSTHDPMVMAHAGRIIHIKDGVVDRDETKD